MVANEAEQFVANNARCASEKETRPKNSGTETLFSVITRSKIPDEEKTAYRITQEGTEMLMASFTPGRTFMNGIYYLGMFPEVLAKLRAELQQSCSDPTTTWDFKTLNRLPYLV